MELREKRADKCLHFHSPSYFIPGFLMQFLSVFAFATWIAPNNVVINQLFGGTTGLSMLPITFDVSSYVSSYLKLSVGSVDHFYPVDSNFRVRWITAHPTMVCNCQHSHWCYYVLHVRRLNFALLRNMVCKVLANERQYDV